MLEFKTNVAKVKKVVDKDDNFMKVMSAFFKDAEKEMLDFDAVYKKSKDAFITVAKFYGVKDREAKETDPMEFFGNIAVFLEKYARAADTIKAEEKKTKQPPKKHAGQKIAQGNEDAMTVMMEKIKSELAASS